MDFSIYSLFILFGFSIPILSFIIIFILSMYKKVDIKNNYKIYTKNIIDIKKIKEKKQVKNISNIRLNDLVMDNF